MFQFSPQLLFETFLMTYTWIAHRSAILVSNLIQKFEYQKFFKKLLNIKFYLNTFSIFQVITGRRTDMEELKGTFLSETLTIIVIIIYFSCITFLYQIIWSDSINPMATHTHFYIS